MMSKGNLMVAVLWLACWMTLVNVSTAEWKLLTNAPWKARCALKVAVFNDNFVLTGGRTLFNFFGDVWQSADGSTWTQTTDSAPWGARSYHQLLVFNNYLWLMGGQNLTHFFNDVWRSADGVKWEFVTMAPWGPRAGFKAVVVPAASFPSSSSSSSSDGQAAGSVILLTGGSINNFNRQFYNDVWVSKNGKDWTQVAATAPWKERAGLQVLPLAVNGGAQTSVFVLGGEHGFAGPYFNDIWQTETLGASWNLTTAAASWSKRSGHLCVIRLGAMYCIGGFYGLHDVWRSKDGKQWSLIDNLAWNCSENKCSKFDFDMVERDGTIYTFGGDHEVTLFPGPQDNEVWAYVPDSSLSLSLSKKKK